MFNRQWFPPGSQPGLSNDSLLFEQYCNLGDFYNAHLILSNSSLRRTNPHFFNRLYSRLTRLKSRFNHHVKTISVTFVDFWPDHDPSCSQFIDLLSVILNRQISVVPLSSEPDIIFYSCYGNTNTSSLPDSSFKLLFLGEKCSSQLP